MSLDHKTTYAIRARHRDSSGDPLSEWSAWSDLWMVVTAVRDNQCDRQAAADA